MMRNFGKIKSIELNKDSIIAGTTALLKEKGNFRGMATVLHLNTSGDWVVQSPFFNGAMTHEMSLHKLVVEDDESGHQYVLGKKEWLGNTQLGKIDNNESFPYDLKPFPFKSGLYLNTCATCGGDFQGAKRQPLCESCCITQAEAKIVISPIKKVPIMVPYGDVHRIAKLAWEAARTDKNLIFTDWFNENY